jgi:riboflavin kinase
VNTIVFSGEVISGKGSGKKYLALQWVKRQIEEKMGFVPCLGTLNIALSEESALRRKFLLKVKSIQICPAEGYCVGLVFKASINGYPCAIIVPQVEGYPDDLLEIIAPVNLRTALQIEDRNSVSVKVYV